MSDGRAKPPQGPQAPPKPEPRALESEGTAVDKPRGFDAIRDERTQAVESVRYRLTGGAAGTAPAGHLASERRSIIGTAAARIIRKASGPAGSGQIPKGSGSPLPADVKARMEPKLGADLSAVRLHTGGDSAQAATNFGARAFTVGNDVHFNAGQFAPGSKEGDKLLAHELTHVVQGQSSGIHRKADDSDDASAEHEGDAKDQVSEPDEPAEKEADAVSENVTEDLHASKEGRSKPRSAEVGATSANKSEKTAVPIAAKLEGTARKLFRSANPGGGGTQGGVWLTTVRGDQVIVDANIAISLDLKAKGQTLNDAQKRNVAMAEQQGIVLTPQVVAELTRKGGSQTAAQTKPGQNLSGNEQKALRTALANIGMNGEADQQVVMEALTAATDGSVATFASADKNVINSLAKHSGVVDPAKLGKYKTVAEYLQFKLGTNVFPVTIEAPNDKGEMKKYSLKVRPVQEIRSSVP